MMLASFELHLQVSSFYQRLCESCRPLYCRCEVQLAGTLQLDIAVAGNGSIEDTLLRTPCSIKKIFPIKQVVQVTPLCRIGKCIVPQPKCAFKGNLNSSSWSGKWSVTIRTPGFPYYWIDLLIFGTGVVNLMYTAGVNVKSCNVGALGTGSINNIGVA